MAPIASYVFLDLETSGLPAEECNKTKITELSLIAVKRSHLLDTRLGESPRVQNKLTLCFNPGKFVYPDSTKVTGLCNDLLENETPFNNVAFDTIQNFLSLLTKPVCLIAQNGLNFDYPILKRHLDNLGVTFPDDLMCADCLSGFFDILSSGDEVTTTSSEGFVCQQANNKEEKSVDELDLAKSVNTIDQQKLNETTPKRTNCRSITVLGNPKKPQLNKSLSGISKVSRRLFWISGPKPEQSYKLKHIYERLLKRPAIEAHRAENDCLMALQCSVAKSKEFVRWVDENHCPFSDVKPMTVGVPLGL